MRFYANVELQENARLGLVQVLLSRKNNKNQNKEALTKFLIYIPLGLESSPGHSYVAKQNWSYNRMHA